MTEQERMQALKELARGMKAACDAEDIAKLRQQEARQRRGKYQRAIESLFADKMAAYEFLLMLKAQAGCQTDDDYDDRIDHIEFPIRPQVVK